MSLEKTLEADLDWRFAKLAEMRLQAALAPADLAWRWSVNV